NLFEYPRMQGGDQENPTEIMQFHASQHLLNPNQPSSSNNPGRFTIGAPGHSASAQYGPLPGYVASVGFL
uniref:Uncharacterized protein n=1 Tax=Panagrolaimus sp. ES5 TaxID=591445 RepID=A0AC34FMK3_9BILA